MMRIAIILVVNVCVVVGMVTVGVINKNLGVNGSDFEEFLGSCSEC